jgi:hypothetical protein
MARLSLADHVIAAAAKPQKMKPDYLHAVARCAIAAWMRQKIVSAHRYVPTEEFCDAVMDMTKDWQVLRQLLVRARPAYDREWTEMPDGSEVGSQYRSASGEPLMRKGLLIERVHPERQVYRMTQLAYGPVEPPAAKPGGDDDWHDPETTPAAVSVMWDGEYEAGDEPLPQPNPDGSFRFRFQSAKPDPDADHTFLVAAAAGRGTRFHDNAMCAALHGEPEPDDLPGKAKALCAASSLAVGGSRAFARMSRSIRTSPTAQSR